MEYYILKLYQKEKKECSDLEQGFSRFGTKKKYIVICLIIMMISMIEIIVTILLYPKRLYYLEGTVLLMIAGSILTLINNKDQKDNVSKYANSHKKKIEILNNVLKNKFGIEGKDKIQELIDIYQDYVNKEVEKEKKYNRVIVAICSALAGVLTISFENMEQIGISFNSWIYLAVLLISFAALATLIIYTNTFLDTLKVKYEMLIKDLKELLLIKY